MSLHLGPSNGCRQHFPSVFERCIGMVLWSTKFEIDFALPHLDFCWYISNLEGSKHSVYLALICTCWETSDQNLSPPASHGTSVTDRLSNGFIKKWIYSVWLYDTVTRKMVKHSCTCLLARVEKINHTTMHVRSNPVTVSHHMIRITYITWWE
jgi:hypothetical protein